jgi:hypothetical protein
VIACANRDADGVAPDCELTVEDGLEVAVLDGGAELDDDDADDREDDRAGELADAWV